MMALDFYKDASPTGFAAARERAQKLPAAASPHANKPVPFRFWTLHFNEQSRFLLYLRSRFLILAGKFCYACPYSTED
jgi:hypothetical protein